MLSSLFADDACYTIKENKEKSFCRGKLPFCRRKLRKSYFALAFSCRGKKSELKGLTSSLL